MSLRFFLSKKKSILFWPKAPVLIHAQGVCTRKDEFPSLVNLWNLKAEADFKLVKLRRRQICELTSWKSPRLQQTKAMMGRFNLFYYHLMLIFVIDKCYGQRVYNKVEGSYSQKIMKLRIWNKLDRETYHLSKLMKLNVRIWKDEVGVEQN